MFLGFDGLTEKVKRRKREEFDRIGIRGRQSVELSCCCFEWAGLGPKLEYFEYGPLQFRPTYLNC